MKIVCTNRKAYHNYHIEETIEAGISLYGTEIKSLRHGKANLADSYATIKDGEAFLVFRRSADGVTLVGEPENPEDVIIDGNGNGITLDNQTSFSVMASSKRKEIPRSNSRTLHDCSLLLLVLVVSTVETFSCHRINVSTP